MFSSVFLLYLLSTQAVSYQLTEEENRNLQDTCGRCEDIRYQYDIYKNAAWAVSVNVGGILTASVISPRHIILFNVFEMAPNGNLTVLRDIKVDANATCDGPDLELPEEVNSLFDVKFVEANAEELLVSRVVVLDGCDRLDAYKPMILETAEDIQFDKFRGPICLADSGDDWDVQEVITVVGLSPEGKQLSTADFEPAKCLNGRLRVEDHVSCAEPVNQSHGLCAGDFGGGAVSENSGIAVLLGIYAEGDVKCQAKPENHRQPEFINVGEFVDAICRQTGICPLSLESDTTTDIVTDTSTTEFSTTSQPSTHFETPTTSETLTISEIFSTSQFPTPSEYMTAETQPPPVVNCSRETEYHNHVKNIKNIHVHITIDVDDNINAQ